MKKATLMILTLLLSVSAGLAQQSRSTQQTIELSPSVIGQAVNFTAHATKATYVRPQRTIEVLSVQVWSDMQAQSEESDETTDDGEEVENEVILQVLVDTTTGQTDLPVGAITLTDGDGSLILMSHAAWWSDQPGDLPVPLSQIKTVKLVHYSDPMAKGSFSVAKDSGDAPR